MNPVKHAIFFYCLISFLSNDIHAKGRPFYVKHFRAGVNIMPEMILTPDYYKYHEFHLSYSTGFLIQLKTNRKTDFTIGLQFTDIRRKGKERTYTPYGLTPMVIYTHQDSIISKVQWEQAIRDIEIPLLVNFKLVGKKLKLTLNTGVSLNYYINQRNTSKFTFKDGHTESKTAISTNGYGSKFSIIPQLSLGVEKEVWDGIILKIEPTIKWQVPWEIFNSYFDRDHLFGVNFSLLKELY